MDREMLMRLVVPMMGADATDLNSAEECVRIAVRAAEEIDRAVSSTANDSGDLAKWKARALYAEQQQESLKEELLRSRSTHEETERERSKLATELYATRSALNVKLGESVPDAARRTVKERWDFLDKLEASERKCVELGKALFQALDGTLPVRAEGVQQ